MRTTIERDASGSPVVTPVKGGARTHVIVETSDLFDGHGTETHAVFITGPVIGVLPLPTGAEYDVTEPVILVKTEHVSALQSAILAQHHAQGRFLDVELG